ncbi:hypothetical protein BAE44_0016245 [Dichanthelium oligosanthes]|uniref:Uncharacterized protein n=1 Tax=Dichanthelium oligosanthes TaxID=888268 RepID=A0A1E5VC59_9POAL|nr:hypothetical protein BAE44_0016245 [Dichanthelium oligosanthes]
MPAMVPASTQPPVLAPQHPVVPPSPSVLPPQDEGPIAQDTSNEAACSSKGKQTGSKPKLSNFSIAEDKVLVSCWINVSTDPVAATGQRKSSFWGHIHASYNMKKDRGHPTRTLKSLSGRWDFIKDQVSKFAGHLRQVQLEHHSGQGPDDEIAEAIKRYNSLEKRAFAIPHCWAALKDEPKWWELENAKAGTEGCKVQPDADDVSASNEAASRAQKRPMGRDSTKESQKRASSSSASQSEEYVSKMSDMCLQRTVFWSEANGEMNQRLDTLVELEREKMEIQRKKEASLEKQTAMQEKQVLLEENKEENRILAMNLETLNPLQRAVMERKQKAIYERWLHGRVKKCRDE